MVRYVDDAPVPSNIFECAAFQRGVRVTCPRGHSAVFDPHGLWWRFEQKGWALGFSGARRNFRCQVCAAEGRGVVRPVKIEAVSRGDGSGEVRLPYPPESEWKAAQRRFR